MFKGITESSAKYGKGDTGKGGEGAGEEDPMMNMLKNMMGSLGKEGEMPDG